MAVAVQYIIVYFGLSEVSLLHRQPPPSSSVASHANVPTSRAGRNLRIVPLRTGPV